MESMDFIRDVGPPESAGLASIVPLLFVVEDPLIISP